MRAQHSRGPHNPPTALPLAVPPPPPHTRTHTQTVVADEELSDNPDNQLIIAQMVLWTACFVLLTLTVNAVSWCGGEGAGRFLFA